MVVNVRPPILYINDNRECCYKFYSHKYIQQEDFLLPKYVPPPKQANTKKTSRKPQTGATQVFMKFNIE